MGDATTTTQPSDAAAGGASGVGTVDTRRFKVVVQRLMRICLTVTMIWLLSLSLDVATWEMFFEEKVRTVVSVRSV